MDKYDVAELWRCGKGDGISSLAYETSRGHKYTIGTKAKKQDKPMETETPSSYTLDALDEARVSQEAKAAIAGRESSIEVAASSTLAGAEASGIPTETMIWVGPRSTLASSLEPQGVNVVTVTSTSGLAYTTQSVTATVAPNPTAIGWRAAA